MSPSASTSGVPGQREVGLDGDAARPVELGAGQLGEAARQSRRGDPRRPDHGAGLEALLLTAGGRDGDALLVDADDRALERRRDAQVLELEGGAP